MKPSSQSIAVIIATTSLAALSACNRTPQATGDNDASVTQTLSGTAAKNANPNDMNDKSGETKAKTDTDTSKAKTAPKEETFTLNVSGRAPQTIKYSTMGDKIRLSIAPKDQKNAKSFETIIDTDTHKALLLNPQQKQYAEVDLDKYAGQAHQKLKNVQVQKTGVTSTIEGRSCEEWKLTDPNYLVNACVTKGAEDVNLEALQKEANFKAPEWVHAIVSQGYIPVRVSIVDKKSGKQLGTSHLTNVDRNVQAADFRVPSGYTKVSPAVLGRQMKQKVPSSSKAKTAPEKTPSKGSNGSNGQQKTK